MNKPILLGIIILLISGCSISQHVEQANISADAEICIIENKEVRKGFLPELEKILQEKQIKYVVTDRNYANRNCEWSATYTARWSWDLTIYMSYAQIRVYKNGVLEGEALYDSTRGGFNMGKFIDAETKIRELVEQLMQREPAPPKAQDNQDELEQAQTKSQIMQSCIDVCVANTSKTSEECFDKCIDKIQ